MSKIYDDNYFCERCKIISVGESKCLFCNQFLGGEDVKNVEG